MQLNQPAPDFELPDLAGKIHRLNDYRGRIVIINFWSAECPWSERADRELMATLGEWGGRVALLTIAANTNETEAQIATAAHQRDLAIVLLAGRIQVPEEYKAQTTPHVFVLDAGGILRYRGAFNDVTFRQRTPSRFYLKEAVEALLAGRLPDPAETQPHGCMIVRHLE